jgi:hypothetical protein
LSESTKKIILKVHPDEEQVYVAEWKMIGRIPAFPCHKGTPKYNIGPTRDRVQIRVHQTEMLRT